MAICTKGMSPLPRTEIRHYDPALLKAWEDGVHEFNSGRYWDAHEKWEQGWKRLPEPERTWVQAWIQLAGVIHLLAKGRIAAARALCQSAVPSLRRRERCRG